MRRRYRKKTVSKTTGRRKTYNFQYNKDLWVRGSREIKKFRDELLPDALVLEGLPFGDSGMAQPCLDHDHKTGYCRGICRADLNLYIGRLELYHRKLFGKTDVDLLTVLKYIINYLEQSEDIPKKLHFGIVEAEVKRINKWRSETIYSKLVEKNLDLLGIDSYNKQTLIEIYINQFIKEKESEQH